MRLARCDNPTCGNETQLAAYEPPPGWPTVTVDREDPLDFCSPGCLATWAAHNEIENHQ